jgi:hypothetical protein
MKDVCQTTEIAFVFPPFIVCSEKIYISMKSIYLVDAHGLYLQYVRFSLQRCSYEWTFQMQVEFKKCIG